MTATGYAANSSLGSVKMAIRLVSTVYSQATVYGNLIPMMPLRASCVIQATGKASKITFVGYHLPIGNNTLASMSPITKLFSVTPVPTVNSLTELYEMTAITPQHELRSLN